MYKLFMYFFFISLLNVVFSSYANVDIKSLPYCSSNTKENLDKIVYVSTLDGKITALNANENGSILWEFKTGDKEMLSSTIQNRELTNSGSWVRMIPSLSGSLYKFDGENIDLVPVTADELLTSSFKYSDDLVFSGGKEMLTYGVGLRNGQLIYKCDIHGCHNETNLDKSIDKDDILIIQKKQQTVHAISPDNGSERWNFSVAQHEIKAVKSTECHANEKFNLDLIIKVVLPEGLIFAVSETNMNHVIWTQKLNSPITNAWKWINNELKPVEIFTGTQWSWNKAPTFNSPSIYVGMHKKQLYIQESAIMQSIASDYVINFKQNYVQNKLPPKIPWKPFPVSSSLVTALMPNYDEGESTEETTDIVSEIGTTSLAVLYASKYINGHGFYLYIDSDLKENEEISCDKLNTSESPPPSSEESDFFFDDETPVQIIIVSLWFWWKEVVVISVTTAFVVNFILARRFLNSSQIQEGVQQEIIFIERHVQIPFDENADKKEMIRHSSESSNSGVDISNGNDLPFNSRFLTDFDVIHCLGKGGFGMVFEARNKIDEWNYAVKQINLPNRLDSRQRVMREVKALAKLDHRNIVRYYNAWLEFPPADWQSNVMSCILDISHSTYESPTEDSISIAEAPGENYNKIDIYDDGDEDDSFIVFGDNSNDSNSKSVSKHRNTSKYSDSNSKNNQIVPKNSTNIIEIVNKSDSSQNNAATTRSTLNVERRMYLYIQMQLCQKESLKDWMLKNVVRDPHSIKVIFEQILSAVEYVHLQGLIHRDLKPSNIFFSLDGEIKIGDFGLVTAMDDDEYVSSDTNTLTKTKFKKHTREVGTQLYMSPEQVKGSFYNYKVDIYSLGVIFFELLTPFSTEMERHKTLSELRLNKFPDSFHQKFQYEHDLLKLMLATKPEKRPTTYGIRSRPPFNHTIDNTKWHFELPPRQGTVK